MSTDHRERADLPPPRVEEVSDRMFAYVQPDGSWGLNNAGFLVGSSGVTVIDTCFTEARNRAFLGAVEAAVGDRPLRTLVNTHHHGDHTFGNHFLPAATIVGHTLCRAEMVESGVATQAFFPGVDFGEVVITPPFLTFDDHVQLYVDDVLIELMHVGPAHTTNDVVAWVPERKLLFTGDVVFHACTPFVLMGSVAGSLTALDRLRALGAETIVPGHGPVAGEGVFDDVTGYLAFVAGLAEEGFAAGASPLDVARGADLGQFVDWPDRERLAGNLHRAYSELRGEPRGSAIDMGAAVADMVAYNGGELPRCLA